MNVSDDTLPAGIAFSWSPWVALGLIVLAVVCVIAFLRRLRRDFRL